MPTLHELTPVPGTLPRLPAASWRARWDRLSPLARDIIVILVVKAAVLGLLWFAFFRAPMAPHMKMDPQRVERNILAPSPIPEPPHAVR
jgi:hypothetical protein